MLLKLTSIEMFTLKSMQSEIKYPIVEFTGYEFAQWNSVEKVQYNVGNEITFAQLNSLTAYRFGTSNGIRLETYTPNGYIVSFFKFVS